jgi:hypothetical protein
MASEKDVTRRDVLRSVVATMKLLPWVAVSGLWMGQEAHAQQKLPKETVKYQFEPKNGQQCSKCTHFEPPNACKLVQGEINPKGWCILYAPKQSS